MNASQITTMKIQQYLRRQGLDCMLQRIETVAPARVLWNEGEYSDYLHLDDHFTVRIFERLGEMTAQVIHFDEEITMCGAMMHSMEELVNYLSTYTLTQMGVR